MTYHPEGYCRSTLSKGRISEEELYEDITSELMKLWIYPSDLSGVGEAGLLEDILIIAEFGNSCRHSLLSGVAEVELRHDITQSGVAEEELHEDIPLNSRIAELRDDIHTLVSGAVEAELRHDIFPRVNYGTS